MKDTFIRGDCKEVLTKLQELLLHFMCYFQGGNFVTSVTLPRGEFNATIILAFSVKSLQAKNRSTTNVSSLRREREHENG